MDRQERDWLQRIANSPEATTISSVYADWLLDRGDPRADFIRLEVEYRQLPKQDVRRRELQLEKQRFLNERIIVPLQADCIEPSEDDPLELAIAALGIPLPSGKDRLVSPRLARLTCQPFDFTNCIGMRFHLLPAGRFLMGEDGNAKCRVQLTQPFHLAAQQVTQEQYEGVTGENPSEFSASGDGSENVAGIDTSRLPVETVSWDNATAFCESLSGKDGLTYRLPTESQWEFACRSGTNTTYCFGDEENQLTAYAVFESVTPQPCGSKLPNAWGLYDMHGNVWEWCSDWYAAYPVERAIDPSGPLQGSFRVYRGGSWNDYARHCQSGYRYRDRPTSRYINYGFRVAQVPLPSSQG